MIYLIRSKDLNQIKIAKDTCIGICIDIDAAYLYRLLINLVLLPIQNNLSQTLNIEKTIIKFASLNSFLIQVYKLNTLKGLMVNISPKLYGLYIFS